MNGQLGSESHVFSLRVWREELGEGAVEWRGRIRDVTGSESLYFHDWETLIRFMRSVLDQDNDTP